MKQIKFTKSCGIYSAGDVAGFDEPIADEYIKRGVAEEFKAQQKPADTARAK